MLHEESWFRISPIEEEIFNLTIASIIHCLKENSKIPTFECVRFKNAFWNVI